MTFNNDHSSTFELVMMIYYQAIEFLMVVVTLKKSGLLKTLDPKILAIWKRLDIRWSKINSNGACKDEGNTIGTEGIIKDWTSN